MQDIGEYLRKMREYRGYSIEDTAKETHISTRYLKAMEAGDFKALPGRAYAFGFLRSYIRFLDGDEKALIDALSEDYPDEEMLLNKPHKKGVRRPVVFDNHKDVGEVEAEMELSEDYMEPVEDYSELPADEQVKNRRQGLYLLLILIVVAGLIVGAVIYLQ